MSQQDKCTSANSIVKGLLLKPKHWHSPNEQTVRVLEQVVAVNVTKLNITDEYVEDI